MFSLMRVSVLAVIILSEQKNDTQSNTNVNEVPVATQGGFTGVAGGSVASAEVIKSSHTHTHTSMSGFIFCIPWQILCMSHE